jgi:BASS family bile acid:Na+ symporter
MTVAKFFTDVYNGALVVFLLTLIASLGMTFTPAQIAAPLKRVWVLLGLVVVNFALIPLAAIGIVHLLPLQSQARTGIEIVVIAAGAPIAMKACQMAKRANVAMAVSFTIILIVLDIPIAPLWAKTLISGAKVDVWSILENLIFVVLLPLVVGLILMSRYPEHRDNWKAGLERTSNIALYIALGVGLAVNWHSLVTVVGTWVLLASVLIIIASAVVGAVVGLGQRETAITTSLLSSFRFTPVGLLVIGTVLHNQSAYLTPALIFVLVDTFLPLGLAAEIGHRHRVPSASKNTATAAGHEVVGAANSRDTK